METRVTQDMISGVAANLKLKEVKVSELSAELDPSGWIIKQTGQLAEPQGTLVSLTNAKGEVIAAVVVSPAAESQFQRITKLAKSALKNTLLISSVWMSPHANQQSLLPAILYFACRRGRIWGCLNVVSLVPQPNASASLATILSLEPLENVALIKDEAGQFMALAQDLQYAIFNATRQLDQELLSFIRDYYVPEITETAERWLGNFYQSSWGKAILNGTLTKPQYINHLYNLHHYVRQTTRLCGRCIFHSEDMELRNHYIYHLKGEVNHELLIERDLAYLGVDIDYIKNFRTPDLGTKQFMTVQESTIAFYEDPALMLACPLAAEGISSHIKPEFKDALYKTIESWGVKNPAEATHFLTSHISFDGGEDGHWVAVINTIKKAIKDEKTLQRFLIIFKAAATGIQRSFDENIDDRQLWSAMPVN